MIHRRYLGYNLSPKTHNKNIVIQRKLKTENGVERALEDRTTIWEWLWVWWLVQQPD